MEFQYWSEFSDSDWFELNRLLPCCRQCLGRERQECGAFGGSGDKIGFFIGFNRFFILHIGGKRSTIRVSTLKEMKLCLR